ncbi:hypothetical protein [Acidovorax sp. BLS4]|nr:hypothetical protein [Paracidovorax avenae]WOI45142.1 hypothetical protein R1Z03_21895 [Paracidovorax avenae]
MMNRPTGQRLGALEHLQQSIGNILATPIGSRVMRRAGQPASQCLAPCW